MEEAKKDVVFADGIYFNKPHENSPEWVKGSVSMKVDEVIPFLQKYKKADGFVNIDLLKSREGKLYFKLNTYVKPVSDEEATRKANLQAEIDKRVPQQVPAGEQLDDSSIPF